MTDKEGQFNGVYQHWDSYPNGLGKKLWDMLHTKYNCDLDAMLRYLIDRHSAGWSVAEEECYCHQKRQRDAETEPNFIDEKTLESDIEWIYTFDVETNRLYIRDNAHGEAAGIVDLAEPEPDWNVLQCDENWERCSHNAWHHGLLPKTSNLSTRTFLGIQPLEFHDAIAFIIDGKRIAATGSGANSDYLNSHGRFPHHCWIATVKASDGRRMRLSVASITEHGYKPLPGVAWAMPPTRDNPNETVMAIS